MCSDESIFGTFVSNKWIFVRRLADECYLKNCLTLIVKHDGGNIIVWGEICTEEMTHLKRIEEIMENKIYPFRILVYCTIPEGKELLDKGFMYQEDYDPIIILKIITVGTIKQKKIVR